MKQLKNSFENSYHMLTKLTIRQLRNVAYWYTAEYRMIEEFCIILEKVNHLLEENFGCWYWMGLVMCKS